MQCLLSTNAACWEVNESVVLTWCSGCTSVVTCIRPLLLRLTVGACHYTGDILFSKQVTDWTYVIDIAKQILALPNSIISQNTHQCLDKILFSILKWSLYLYTYYYIQCIFLVICMIAMFGAVLLCLLAMKPCRHGCTQNLLQIVLTDVLHAAQLYSVSEK